MRRPGIREFVVAAALFFAAITAARAEDDGVEVGVGSAFRLSLEKAFQTVIVGDPLVLDVRSDDERSVVVEPLRAGETHLVFVDARGMVVANVRISIRETPPANRHAAGHSL